MKLIFEIGNTDRGCDLLPETDVPVVSVEEKYARRKELNLPSFLKQKSAGIIQDLQKLLTVSIRVFIL